MLSSSLASSTPELLAPAGDWDCLRAAIENGADAVYFGLDCGFNARARAQNFGLDDLPEVLRQLHRRGLRGYVTLNTLVFPSELPRIAEALQRIAESGVDAVLVQDLGLARLVRQTCPELELHASTQMTMTSSEGIEVARRLGVSRVVLARELSISEIRKIREKTEMPLEVFVHGALCVAYSGQCLTSESLGGRSANRGQCAQACRLPYDLVVDDQPRELGDVRYLLSPQDLAAYALVPELIEAGVCSLKIEGRLKTAEYVANITRHYRTAIDEAMAGRPVQFTRRQIHEMELSFSRGFSPGWLQGCDHKMLVPGDNSAKRGVRLGDVLSVQGQRVVVRLEAAVARGDGVAFEGDRTAGTDQGGRVYELSRRGKPVREPEVSRGVVELAFDASSVDTARIYPGQRVWKTDDPRLRRRLRASFNTADPTRRIPLDLRITAQSGERLHLHATTANGLEVVVESDSPLEPARRHPASESGLREQFSRLGGTPFELRNLEARIEGEPMIPHSVTGAVRRVLVERLIEAAEAQPPRSIDPDALNKLSLHVTEPPAPESAPASTLGAAETSGEAPQLWVLCRTQAQIAAAIDAGARQLYADFHDIREYGAAVETARAAGATIYLATLRIQKPGELGLTRKLLRHSPDGLLVRNLASLEVCREAGVAAVADFSLNVANHLTADFLRASGAARLTVSYDLNRDQLGDLVSAVPTRWLEVVVHQHMPMFHMEHCVFCSVLSPGTNKTNCGRPCDTHLVKLRDRIGMDHPLQADVGCRNTLFNAVPQSGAEVIPEMLTAGVRAFRVELLEDDAAQTRRILTLYSRLLAGSIEPREVWQELKAANRVGVTRGTLEQRRNPLAIV
ncbi:U32 family peptidase [Candidatus Laterigemmans baculatus]|uniref:U32 family peptidase n=1 Tax=Candidatus Laterigemmans baculatus TaxID=2770505 RepID=UPI0013DD1BEA|nr:U32 family peptidase [Candidatus Laterigemmans baculatus]